MKHKLWRFIFLIFLFIGLSGCNKIGDKAGSTSIIYCVTAIISFLILISNFFTSYKKKFWYFILIFSVFVVNLGYFLISVSNNLTGALMANRISYFGSVFLPLSMLMIILSITKIEYKKILPVLLGITGIIVFLIAASPGILPIYYKEVCFETVNGVSALKKVYGPLHSLYLVYLLGYFASMCSVIVYSIVKKKIKSISHAVIMLVAVFINLSVWFIEQLVRIDFELLSVSYILSEFFLLGLSYIISENEKLKTLLEKKEHTISTLKKTYTDLEKLSEKELENYHTALGKLTQTECLIYEYYIQGLATKDVMKKLDITENTLKFHNKNIYNKFSVSSRKELLKLNQRFVISNK